jgi:hypothetical protein
MEANGGVGLDRRATTSRIAPGVVCALLAVVALLALGAAPASALDSAKYTGLSFGPDGTAGTSFSSIQAIAVDDSNGDIYVYDGGMGTLHKFNSAGQPSKFANRPSNVIEGLELVFSAGAQIAIDSSGGPTDGNIYVTSRQAPGVRVFDASGNPLGTIGVEYASCGVAVDGSGHVFASESPHGAFTTFGINEYVPKGSFPTEADKTRSSDADNGLFSICSVGVDGLGRVYVSTIGGAGGSVTRFDNLDSPSGKRLDSFASTFAINSATGELYANRSEFYYGGVAKYDAEGNFLVSFATSGPELITESFGIAVNGSTGTPTSGDVYVSKGGTQVEVFAPSVVPDVVTGPPSFVDHNAATVTGSVNPAGNSLPVTSCIVEFGTETAYGESVPCSPASLPAGTADVDVTAELTGLATLTTYHYRFVTTNAEGTSYGEDRTVTAAAVRGVDTKPATSVARTSATLNGTLDPDGESTDYYFEYGPGTNYGQQIPAPPGVNVGSAAGVVPVTEEVVGLLPETTYHYRIVAKNSVGETFGPDVTFTTPPAVNAVLTAPATDVQNTTATVHGSFEPEGIATQYYFEYGASAGYGLKAPLPAGSDSGSGVTSVSTALTELQPGVTYHYRLVAGNSFGTTSGPDRTFSTTQAPRIAAVFATEVLATSARLNAKINPNGFATKYRFEYGTTVALGSVAPIPDGELGAVDTAQDVSVALDDLESGVVYRYRVSAESVLGTTTSEIQTFSFYPPPCPNAQVRQQTGSSMLPDCRAYELVSPGNTGAIVLVPGAPSPTYAVNPTRFAFAGVFGILEGTPPNSWGDLYVSTRSDTGWSTKYVGLRSDEALQPSVPSLVAADPGLNTFMERENGNEGFTGPSDHGSYAPYLWNANGDLLGRLPANLNSIPGGKDFVGDVKSSADMSNVAISAQDPAFVPGALTAPPGSAYDNDRDTGQIHLISITPQGDPIQADVLAGGDPREYILFPGISKDGSHILMSTSAQFGNVHLYMRVDDRVSYDVSRGTDGQNHGVRYIGMTADGSRVLFTSDEQLTADDHDTSTDLFAWNEQGDTVTRLSGGSNGAGDTDNCASSSNWTSKCGIIPVKVKAVRNGISESPLTDTMMDETPSGGAYFYSPELLDGVKGLLGKRNLYVSGDDRPRFVATFADSDNGSDPIRRIQVSPDGKHTAFITKSRLTAYDNAGRAMMYTFNRASGAIQCVSCLPTGAAPKSDVEGSVSGIFQTFDGRAFFSTADSLVRQDTNGIEDVYEFTEGHPQLISSGIAARGEGGTSLFGPPQLVAVTGNGQNVYFSTYDTLVRGDDNGAFLKFYDARAAGGFPNAPEAAPCAAADECHGPGNAAPAAPQIGSDVNLGDRGNMPAAKHKKHKKHKHKGHKNKKKQQQHKKKSKQEAGKSRRAGR